MRLTHLIFCNSTYRSTQKRKLPFGQSSSSS